MIRLVIGGALLVWVIIAGAIITEVADAGKGKGGRPQAQLVAAPACAVEASFALAAGATETFELSGCEAFTRFAFYSDFAHPGQNIEAFDGFATDQVVTIVAPNGEDWCGASPAGVLTTQQQPCAVNGDDHDGVGDVFFFGQNGVTMGEFGGAGVWRFVIENHGTQQLRMSVLAGGN